jgi:SAM-dependent MidA family methyltransferase
VGRGVKPAWPTWREAVERALYGPGGFYRRSAPAGHFRTSVHASGRFADALATVLERVDAALGHPAALDLVDVGAGRGELVTGLLERAPAALAARLRPLAVERAGRPSGLPAAVTWSAELPERITGLVVANEWLDNVPVDVVEQTGRGLRLVLVDPATGAERLGPVPDAADVEWLRRWWPLVEPGDRAEVGRPRDSAWADLIGRLDRGVAIAVDYAHHRAARPPGGTLAGHRGGRAVPPVPDGSCDVTTHVALDACAAAAAGPGAGTVLTDQRTALRALGLRGARPDPALARTDPAGFVRALARAGEEAELIDPAGLGSFGWLVRAVEMQATEVIRVTIHR